LLGSSDYPVCGSCEEHFREALKVKDGRVICGNCSAKSERKGICRLCEREGPIELHHVGGRELSPVMIAICSNCHAILTAWQRRRRRALGRQGLTEKEMRTALLFSGYEDPLKLYHKRFGKNPSTLWEFYVDGRCSVRN
jgi:hypothetical protein